jgi:hypothetical protein
MLGQALLEDQNCSYARYCAELLACATGRAPLDQSVNGNCCGISTGLVGVGNGVCIDAERRIVEPIKVGGVAMGDANPTENQVGLLGPRSVVSRAIMGKLINHDLTLHLKEEILPQSESEESSRIFAGHKSIAAGALSRSSCKLSNPALTNQNHHRGFLWMFYEDDDVSSS